MRQKVLIHDEYDTAGYQLVCDDTLHFLKTMESESVQLVITSPPYNIGKSYENRVSIQYYLETQKNVLAELVRLLNKKGSVCWQVGNYVDGGEVFPLDIHYYGIFKDLGLKPRNRIIWHFSHGFHASKRFSGRYETVSWFTKSDDYIFNLDNVRIPSKMRPMGRPVYEPTGKEKITQIPLEWTCKEGSVYG